MSKSGPPRYIEQLEYYGTPNNVRIDHDDTAYSVRHLEALIQFGDIHRADRLLEVGAGMGRFSAHLAQKGFNLKASDISPVLIASLRKRIPGIDAFVCDIDQLRERVGEPFDKVIGFFVLHHLHDLRRSFKSIASAVKPGGTVVFCEPNAYYLPFYFQILFSPNMRWAVDRGVAKMRPGLLFAAMEAAGFCDLAIRRYGYFPPQLYRTRVGQRLEGALESLRLPSAMHAFQLIRGQKPDDS